MPEEFEKTNGGKNSSPGVFFCVYRLSQEGRKLVTHSLWQLENFNLINL